MGKPRLALLLATWGGLGYFPIAPGTVGSLAGAAVAWLVLQGTGWPAWSLGLLAAALLPAAAWSAGEAERASGKEDPGFVVVDEVIGQWIALAAIRPERWRDWILAVALFRIFDIVKPPPIRTLERLHGGWGVVLDDVAAGCCAMMILAILRWYGGF